MKDNSHKLSGQMSVLHVICFVLFLMCGLYAAGLARMHFGHWVYAVAAFPLGLFLAYAAFRTLGLVGVAMHRWRPILPACKNGKCTWEDYRFVETVEAGDVFVCACGEKYVRNARRFLALDADGTLRPYMAYKPLGRWRHVSLLLLVTFLSWM